MRTALLLLFTFVLPAPAYSQANRTLVSTRVSSDFELTADPRSPVWKHVTGVVTDRGRRGERVVGHRTEIRSVWTPANLYLLFTCKYDELNLKPNPSSTIETNQLWDWDVAEAFIGTDFAQIKHYKEYQVSPQGEWVDLDIDRGSSPPKHDVSWDSGYQVMARIDKTAKIWYGEMKIPFAKLDRRKPEAGLKMRANFYRIQGPGPKRKYINWQPVNSDNYHTPEAFGILELGGSNSARRDH